jgi:hypothetical protein
MNFKHRPQVAPMTELLLAHGAEANVLASLRHEVGGGEKGMREYRDVAPVSWGEQFVEPLFVSQPALRLIHAASPP